MAEVDAVALSQDGRYALICLLRTALEWWDLRDGRRLGTLAGHPVEIVDMALAPDGRHVITADGNWIVRWWDLAAGRCLHTFPLPGDEVTTVAVTSDQRHAVVAGPPARVLRLETGRAAPWSYSRPHGAADLSRHEADFRTHLDNARLLADRGMPSEAVASLRAARSVPGFQLHPDLLALWRTVREGGRRTRLQRAQEVRVLPDEPDGCVTLHPTLTADGTRGLFIGPHKTLEFRELASGQRLHRLGTERSFTDDYAITPDGTVAVASAGDRVRWWDLTTGEEGGTLTGHTDAILAVAVTADGRRALTSSIDHTIRWWDLATGTCLLTIPVDDIAFVDLTPDGRYAITASEDLRTWDLTTGRCVITIPVDEEISALAIAPDGSHVLTGSWEGYVRWWSLTTGEVVHTFPGHDDWVRSAALTDDVTHALTASTDGTLRWWDITTGALLDTIVARTSDLSAMVLTPDASQALVRGDAGMCLWEFTWEYTAD